MSKIIGIDVGGSTTKIVGFDGNKMISPLFVKASDQLASVYGAFGKFTDTNSISLKDISKVMMTGVGSSFFADELYGIDAEHVSEFECVGRGGLYLSGLDKAIIVSMGTGTSYVLVEGDKLSYLGGIAIGGGTILGLSKLLLNTKDIDAIQELAAHGDYRQIDLRIGDISKNPLPGLNLNVTAANFGKVEEMVSKEDIAAGIVHMVIENLCHTGTLIAQDKGVKEFILIGSLANFDECDFITKDCAELAGEGVYFVIPEHAGFGTAIGAALVGVDDCKAV